MRTMCQRIGRPPISTSALGIAWVCSRSRVPRPPARMATVSTPSGMAADYPPASIGLPAGGAAPEHPRAGPRPTSAWWARGGERPGIDLAVGPGDLRDHLAGRQLDAEVGARSVMARGAV